MRFVPYIFFLLFILVRFSFSQSGMLTGKIVDEDTGQPVTGAGIRVLGTGLKTTSDQKGIYTILYEIPENYYILEFTGVGYQDASKEDVVLRASDTVTVNIALIPTHVGLNTITMRSTAPGPENAVHTPASIAVVNREAIQSEIALSSDVLLRNVAGVDLATTGLDRREINIRGFNTVFNAAPFVLTDYRQASAPSLGVNLYSLMPLVTSDLYRMEVVRDPSSAIYGQGAESGVVHYISKNPFSHPGLSLSVGGGERSSTFGSFRGAASLFKRIGFKVTGQYARGENWELDPRDRFDRRLLDADATGVDRNYDYQKMNLNGELQLRLFRDVRLTASGGIARLKDNVMTILGTAYADSLEYTFGQARLHAGRFFAQGYVNEMRDGYFFLYGLNTPLVDKGKQIHGEARYTHPFSNGRKLLTAGGDINMTTPQTEGTIYGRNENNDEINEFAGYLHYTQKFSNNIDVTLALRGDYNSLYESVRISPRIGVVRKLNEFHALRATFNQSSALPAHPSLFLDLPLSETILNTDGDYKIIFQGRGAAKGFTFNQFNNTRMVTMMAALPHLPQNPFGQRVSLDAYPVGLAYLNTAFFTEAMFAGPLENIPPDLRPLEPEQQEALVELLTLMGQRTLASGESTRGILGIPNNSNLGYKPVEEAQNVAPLKMPISNTIELGYKGIIKNRLLFSLDGFYSLKQNFVSLIHLETPFVYLSPDYIRPQMIGFIASGDPVVDELVKQLGIGRSATVGLLTTLYSQTPSGIVQPDAGEDGSGVMLKDQPNAVGGLLTYRNFGKVQYMGLDLSLQYLATYKLTLFGNLSLISDNFFDNKELKESDTDLALALNAPTVKTSFGFLHSNPRGTTFGMSARYIHSFPVLAGPYVGGLPAPYGYGIGGVKNYFIVDMNLGYSLRRVIPGLRFDLTINNIFGYKHREFVGAPQVGRLALLQATFGL